MSTNTGGPGPDWTAGREAAEALLATWHDHEPGGALVLFGPDGPRVALGGGLASLEHRIPFAPNTPTRYASISKQFMAATLLLAGVDLDQPLGASLPDLPGPLAAVPLSRALDMTGGLPDMMEVMAQAGVPFTADLPAPTIMRALRRLPGTCAAPGTEMAYSNTGWRLAQSVVAARCGAEYEAVLRRLLLDPLDLPVRFSRDEAEPVPGLATGYWRGGAAFHRGRYGLHFSASGGLAGSALDLAAWGSALLSGRFPGLLDRLSAPRALLDETPNAYRLGLIESTLGGARVLGHGGSLPGYRNAFLLAPERNCGLALLTNREADALLPALGVLASLLGVPAPLPDPVSPSGLFAASSGPFWAEAQSGALCFMGSTETLLAQNGGGWHSPPSSLAITLELRQGALSGRIGGVRRELLPVPPELPVDPALTGTWRNDPFGAALTVRRDGTALFPAPAKGLAVPVPLTPLPNGRALAALTHGPWTQRPCLVLEDENTLLLAGHRARVLRFRRAEA